MVKQKDTGQLSPVTVFCRWLGNASKARKLGIHEKSHFYAEERSSTKIKAARVLVTSHSMMLRIGRF